MKKIKLSQVEQYEKWLEEHHPWHPWFRLAAMSLIYASAGAILVSLVFSTVNLVTPSVGVIFLVFVVVRFVEGKLMQRFLNKN